MRLEDGEIDLRPIAGTRPRGAHAEEDARARGRAARRSEGARRAPHARRPRPQRRRPRRRDRHACAVTEYAAIERYSHVMHIVSNVAGAARARPRLARRLARDASRRARSRARRRCARWRSSTSSRPCGAASTAAASATSTSPATWTRRSRSARMLVKDGEIYRAGGRRHRRRLRPRARVRGDASTRRARCSQAIEMARERSRLKRVA